MLEGEVHALRHCVTDGGEQHLVSGDAEAVLGWG